jgi:hypothetical protein
MTFWQKILNGVAQVRLERCIIITGLTEYCGGICWDFCFCVSLWARNEQVKIRN